MAATTDSVATVRKWLSTGMTNSFQGLRGVGDGSLDGTAGCVRYDRRFPPTTQKRQASLQWKSPKTRQIGRQSRDASPLTGGLDELLLPSAGERTLQKLPASAPGRRRS